MRYFFAFLGSALILLVGATASAATPASVISSGKSATALVEVERPGRKSSGTAFCIDAAGFFVTNRHVVGDANSVKLLLNPGETNQLTVTASVVRTDAKNDLALLKAELLHALHRAAGE